MELSFYVLNIGLHFEPALTERGTMNGVSMS